MTAQLSVHDGLFWLDNQPVLLQAAELHYFRLPPDQWPQRLDLIQRAGFNAVATYIPWLWHQPAQNVFDFDGRTHPQRDLCGFLDLAAARGLWIIARPGPYIMAETINEGVPPWVFESYPQVAVVDQHGQPQNIASYLHPDFLACAADWYRAVFRVLTPRQAPDGKIVLIQLDNEMGMMHWVRNMLDTNPDTLARFAVWTQDRYVADDLPAFLRAGLRDPQALNAAAILADYRAFYRNYLADYARFLLQQAEANGLAVPAVFNIHGFGNGGKTFPIGLSQLVEVLRLPDVLSATDVYPMTIGEGNLHHLLLVNAMTAALQNPAQPLLSLEFQAGGADDFSNSQTSFYDLHMRLSVAVGLRGVNHYLFFDGENHPLLSPIKRHNWGHPVRLDGSLRRHYHRYPRLSGTLAAYGEALLGSRPHTITTVGFHLDDFMTEVNHAATEEATRILTHQRDMILFDFIARGLTITHRPFNALDLTRAQLDPAQTPVLWAMLEPTYPTAVQQALIRYAQAGGRLVLMGRLGADDDTTCTHLRATLGVTAVQGDPPFTSRMLRVLGIEEIPASFVETYTGAFERVIATCAGETVGFVQPVGRGEVVMLGAAFAANTLAELDVFDRLAAIVHCPPAFTVSEWADVRLSEGVQGSFLFINNYQDDPIRTTVAQNSRPLFGGHALRLAARQGAILPLNWAVQPDVLVHYLTAEVRQVERTADTLVLHLAHRRFHAELTLAGWRHQGRSGRVHVRGTNGRLVLTR